MEQHTETVIDPVCGMQIDRATATRQIITDESDYYFCSKECMDAFRESPGDYVPVRRVDPAHIDDRAEDRDEFDLG